MSHSRVEAAPLPTPLPASTAPRRDLRAGCRARRVALGTIWALAAFWTYRFWHTEGVEWNIAYTVAVTLAIAGVLMLVSRRPLFAALATSGMLAIVTGAAMIKRRTMDMVVHAYDLVFYATWSTVTYLWSDFRGYVIALITSFFALALVGVLAWRYDPLRISRRVALIGTALAIAGSVATAELKGERRHLQFYFDNLYVSSFYASWGETIETLWRGQLIEAARAAPGAAFVLPESCPTTERPPHVILIHQESVVPPSIFPQLAYDRSVDPFFQSDGGRMHKLRVETYGGASWLTEFSILAGVSTHAFGGMRQFVQLVMQGKLKDTVPEVFARCGYRNVVFYPMLKNFVSNGPFYASIGLKEIFDLKDQGAKHANERDRFYYGNALDLMERHVKASEKPLFTYIQTMAAHWPYDVPYSPEIVVPGGGPGTHPEMHEYLRRVSFAKLDMDWLWSELRRRFPSERILVVHYGDHHPLSTRMLLGYGEDVQAEDVALKQDSLGFITYYSARGHNYAVPPLPDHEALDVPYLGSLILKSAGLPLSDSHRERLRLMTACQGRYNTCTDRQSILAFHRRLIDSGLMKAR